MRHWIVHLIPLSLGIATAAAVWFVLSTRSYVSTLVAGLLGRQVPTCGCEQILAWSNHPLLYTLLIAGSGLVVTLALAAGSVFIYRMAATRRFVKQLLQLGVTSQNITIQSSLIPLDIIDTDEPIAMTVGIWSPRVMLGRVLYEQLKENELRAILHHEHAHMQRFHILTRMVLSSSLAVLPLPTGTRAQLHSAIETYHEHIADSSALQHVESSDLLAACVTCIEYRARTTPQSSNTLLMTASFGSLDQRLHRLTGTGTPHTNMVAVRSIAQLAAVCSAIAVFSVFAVSIPARAEASMNVAPGTAALCAQEQRRAQDLQSRNTIIQTLDGAQQCSLSSMSVDPFFEINYPQ